jgi:hypothetical protein
MRAIASHRCSHERSQSLLSPPSGFRSPIAGHRTYLDPNPRLCSTRTTVWRAPEMKGHRKFQTI